MRNSPFFDGIAQADLSAGGQPVKVPLFYYDGTAMTAIFPARLSRLRAALPDPRIVPARLAPGVGVVGVSCFEYRDTDLGPYNELAISIILSEPYFRSNLPGRALTSALRRHQFDAWVHHLPVTTEIARAAGVEYYNYPKFLASIDFTEEHGRRTCRLAEGQEHILTLSGRTMPTAKPGKLQFFSHLWMDRQPQSSEFKIQAAGMRERLSPAMATLTLGDQHPIARELNEMLLWRRPLYYHYLSRFEGILYGPEHLTAPLMFQALAASPLAASPAHDLVQTG
ncbi:MAG TPA: acetoacetate decarboxylase family protein [Mycobacterium sp.]|nr:acetoacetate decarboxylase family protein [Mycobacterium sp.]